MDNPTENYTEYHRLPIKGFEAAFAQISSDIFSPFLMPVYATALCLWVTPLKALPDSPRIAAILFVVCLAAVVPFISMLVLIRLKRVSGMSVSLRQQRFLPYSIGIICFICCALYFKMVSAPWWLVAFFLSAALAVVFIAIINIWWKISAHATACGCFLGLALWLTFTGLLLFSPLIVISATLLVCGLVGYSRLALARHSLLQVVAGWAIGLLTVFFGLFLGIVL